MPWFVDIRGQDLLLHFEIVDRQIPAVAPVGHVPDGPNFQLPRALGIRFKNPLFGVPFVTRAENNSHVEGAS